ncbi:hypothetical protein ACFE04_002576 [Oxalis oulophora]
MSRILLIRRVAPYFVARIGRNHSSTLHIVSISYSYSSDDVDVDVIHIKPNCIKRMKDLQASEASSKEMMLRLSAGTDTYVANPNVVVVQCLISSSTKHYNLVLEELKQG